MWLSRPIPARGEDEVLKLGIKLPLEEEVNREILLRKGVPASRIHFYGRTVLSTVDEAVSFARTYPSAGKRIVLVTSRYHARRARMIFRKALRGAQVRVAATPYERRPPHWWSDKFMAEQVVLEVTKTAYYLLGGRFVGLTAS